MRTHYKTIWVLTLAAVIFLSTSVVWGGRGKRDTRGKDGTKCETKQFKLTDEKIEYMMGRLEECNPEKAKELKGLRKKDPAAFEAELCKIMHKRFGDKSRGRRDESRGRREKGRGWGSWHDKGGKGYGDRCEEGKGKGEKHGEYIKWLEKHYPEKAKRLAGMRESKPELYRKQLGFGRKRFGRVMDMEKENPALAAALKEDLELKGKRDKLLRKIRGTVDDKEKAELKVQLKDVVSKRFDTILKRKQIEYERLRKRLERFKKRVEKSEAEAKKWQEVKGEKVSERMEELMSQVEGFNWE